MNQSDYAHNYFQDFWDTLYNMFVCQTTSNHPDLLFPIFREYRASSVFFLMFMLMNYFLLYNMIIAIFYFNLKEVLHETVEETVRKNKYSLLEYSPFTSAIP